jgi:K+-transporting ATPase KdpF subunit
MKTIPVLLLVTQSEAIKAVIPMEMNSTMWIVTGGIVASLILIYLVYALIKPKKF